jgi:hypothetical protein
LRSAPHHKKKKARRSEPFPGFPFDYGVVVIVSGAVFPTVSETVNVPVDGSVVHAAVAVKFVPEPVTVIHDAGEATTVNVPVYGAPWIDSLSTNAKALPCWDGMSVPVVPTTENDEAGAPDDVPMLAPTYWLAGGTLPVIPLLLPLLEHAARTTIASKAVERTNMRLNLLSFVTVCHRLAELAPMRLTLAGSAPGTIPPAAG